MAQTGQRRPHKHNKVFISWSGPNSKEFAKGLKQLLVQSVFAGSDLQCFVSDEGIISGNHWWEKIKTELRTCKLGILCITKENLYAPWVYFEAGAMIAQEVPVIPLLVSCSLKALATTPLNGIQAIEFYDQKKFMKMLKDINSIMNYGYPESQIDTLGKDAYTKLICEFEPVFGNLKSLRTFNVKYVYPPEVSAIKRKTIFVSAPMSSISKDDYTSLRNNMLKVIASLEKLRFKEIHCPIIDIDSPEQFDGKTKAIKNNFPLMKSVDCMLAVYPWKNASSSLVEIGYGIALSKKMVLFHGEGLPFILDEAGGSIVNIKTYAFKSYDDIVSIIDSNGMALFEGIPDE